jgi:zinc protease
VALDALATLAFSRTSDLYQKLVVREQKVDALSASSPFRVDPDLFSINARVKRPEDLSYVRDQILETVKRFQNELVEQSKLDAVRNRDRYSFVMDLDNSESVAEAVTQYVSLQRTPATIDRLYAQAAQLTPADLRDMARKYLVENQRTIVTLTGASGGGDK